jgi:hypothetical protein
MLPGFQIYERPWSGGKHLIRSHWQTGAWFEAVEAGSPRRDCHKCSEDVVNVGRYLLVLDTDLLALDEKRGPEPINYLSERQQHEPCEVVVLSLVDTGQTKPSSLELLLGGATSHAASAPAKFPTASRPDHDVSAAAERRMNLAVRHLKTIGCQASGLISDEDLVKAVDAETRGHDYDEVILATSGHDGSWLARTLHLDPIHHLQRRWGKKLTVFATGPLTEGDH